MPTAASGDLASDGELIDLIYASLLGETTWTTFLDRISDGMPGGLAALFSHDVSRGEGVVALYTERDDSFFSAYEQHYVSVSPWAPRCALRRVGEGILADDVFSHDRLVRTEFYNDFLVKNGAQTSMGVTVVRDNERSMMLTTLTDCADPDINRPIADRFTRIASHLRRAVEFYRSNPGGQAASELGGNLLDAYDVGTVIVGEGCRPKVISDRARDYFVTGAPTRLSPLGRLVLGDDNAQSALLAMLSPRYEGAKSLVFDEKGSKLTLVHVEKDRFSLFFEGPTVVLLIETLDRRFRRTFDEPLLVHRYNLTAGETRALSGMVAGKTVDEIAIEASLSRETTRSQVKSLYAKVGVRSEAELLRLVFTGRARNAS